MHVGCIFYGEKQKAARSSKPDPCMGMTLGQWLKIGSLRSPMAEIVTSLIESVIRFFRFFLTLWFWFFCLCWSLYFVL